MSCGDCSLEATTEIGRSYSEPRPAASLHRPIQGRRRPYPAFQPDDGGASSDRNSPFTLDLRPGADLDGTVWGVSTTVF